MSGSSMDERLDNPLKSPSPALSRLPSSNGTRIRLGAFAWLLAIQFFVAQVVVASAWTRPFSLATGYISDLGTTTCGPYPTDSDKIVCSPWHAGMNASFVVVGLTMVVGAALARDGFNPGRNRGVGLALIAVAGLGVLAVGLFPQNENYPLHAAGAGINFVTGNVGLILLGRTGLAGRPARVFQILSVALGVAGLVATVLFGSHYTLGLGAGSVERVAAYSVTIWQILAGAALWRRAPAFRA